jgi:hypothetical protein
MHQKSTHSYLDNMKTLTFFLILFVQTSFAQQKLTFERPTMAGETIYYEGEVKNGKANGYGTATTSLKNAYKGNWKDNDYHGQGTHTWENGMQYSGSWVNGQGTGKAIHTWPNGDKYEGDFINGNLHGNGIYYFNNGMQYSGSWVNGKRTGKGIHTWLNGEKYEGDFVDGAFHGNGIFYFNNGMQYSGSWVNGKRTGKGIHTWTNGEKYVGDFVDGTFHGEGTYYFNNGEQYSGNWVNGQRTGYGKYTYANGNVQEGQFLNGVLQVNSYNNTNPVATTLDVPYEEKDDLTILREMSQVIQGETVYLYSDKTNYFIPNPIYLKSVNDEITLIPFYATYAYSYSSGRNEFGVNTWKSNAIKIKITDLMTLLYETGGAYIVSEIGPCMHCSGQGSSWDNSSRTRDYCEHCGATGCVPVY